MVDRGVKTFDYLRSLPEIEPQILEAVSRVLHSGRLILGPETQAFEREFAQLIGCRHCIGVNSGTSAIYLALAALGVGAGDEVITVSNTCVPTVAAIRQTGATPVFVDVAEHDLMMDPELLEAALSKQTKCILPVHLWGQSADIPEILAVAGRHGLNVVEDCAQAHGTTWDGRPVGSFGKVGCFSFYPTKNIGAFGEAGAIVTDDDDLAMEIRSRRMYGYDASAIAHREGTNARISEIQAAILRVKLRVFDDWLQRRRRAARSYFELIDSPSIRLPQRKPLVAHSYHQFVVRCAERERVTRALEARNIGFGIHYPTPVHLMPAYRFLGGPRLELPVTVEASGQILSLPIHESLEDAEVAAVAEAVNLPRAKHGV